METSLTKVLAYTSTYVDVDAWEQRTFQGEHDEKSTNSSSRLGGSFVFAKMSMSYVARALEVDETRGFMKVVVDAESSQILGAAVLGIEGGEIMAQIQIAMMGNLPYTALKDGIFAHPTLAESLNNLFSHFED